MHCRRKVPHDGQSLGSSYWSNGSIDISETLACENAYPSPYVLFAAGSISVEARVRGVRNPSHCAYVRLSQWRCSTECSRLTHGRSHYVSLICLELIQKWLKLERKRKEKKRRRSQARGNNRTGKQVIKREMVELQRHQSVSSVKLGSWYSQLRPGLSPIGVRPPRRWGLP